MKKFTKGLVYLDVKCFVIRLSALSLYDGVWHDFAICFSTRVAVYD